MSILVVSNIDRLRSMTKSQRASNLQKACLSFKSSLKDLADAIVVAIEFDEDISCVSQTLRDVCVAIHNGKLLPEAFLDFDHKTFSLIKNLGIDLQERAVNGLPFKVVCGMENGKPKVAEISVQQMSMEQRKIAFDGGAVPRSPKEQWQEMIKKRADKPITAGTHLTPTEYAKFRTEIQKRSLSINDAVHQALKAAKLI